MPDNTKLSAGLRQITKALHIAKLADAGGFFGFGGDFGYGADFENDVFEMHYDRQHPSCECGGSMPKHTVDCDTVTKREAWLDTRDMIGMVKAYPDAASKPRGSGPMADFFAAMAACTYTATPTTYAEQEAWMKANPFPSCSCGQEAAWRAAHPGIEPNDDGFESPHPSDFEHARTCDWSVIYRPNFTHKPSASTIEWYKYIGRDMKPKLSVPWPQILRECLASIRGPQ
jgi:hypothetical protein